MLFIILCVNNETARITERCRERKQIRGLARPWQQAGLRGAREAWWTAISRSLAICISEGEAGRGEVFQLNADYIALSRY